MLAPLGWTSSGLVTLGLIGFVACCCGGSELQQQQQQQISVESNDDEEGDQLKRICPDCGMQNPADAKYCGDCGFSFKKSNDND
jgi:ribosomal protein S27AE